MPLRLESSTPRALRSRRRTNSGNRGTGANSLRYDAKRGGAGRLLLVAVVVAAVIALPVGAAVLLLGAGADGASSNADTASAQASSSEPKQLEVEVLAVGDIMLHYPNQVVYDEAGNSVLGAYFDGIRSEVSAASVALCNIEAPFGGGEPAGYPLFNMADEMATAVRDAGFDVANTANNHLLDRGSAGVLRTLEVLHAAGLATTGSRTQASEPPYTLVQAQGLTFGFVSATYETGPLESEDLETESPATEGRFINYIPVPAELEGLVDTYMPNQAAGREAIAARITAARQAGAEVVICYFHNGTEYKEEPNEDQRALAQAAANAGADIIFASHPHVVQPMELLMPAGGNKPVPVYWALGNYVSNQRVETEIGEASERGILARVSLTLDGATKQITALSMDYTPLWVDRYYVGERPVHVVVPELPATELASWPSFEHSHNLARAQAAFAALHGFLGAPLTWQR